MAASSQQRCRSAAGPGMHSSISAGLGASPQLQPFHIGRMFQSFIYWSFWRRAMTRRGRRAALAAPPRRPPPLHGVAPNGLFQGRYGRATSRMAVQQRPGWMPGGRQQPGGLCTSARCTACTVVGWHPSAHLLARFAIAPAWHNRTRALLAQCHGAEIASSPRVCWRGACSSTSRQRRRQQQQQQSSSASSSSFSSSVSSSRGSCRSGGSRPEAAAVAAAVRAGPASTPEWQLAGVHVPGRHSAAAPASGSHALAPHLLPQAPPPRHNPRRGRHGAQVRPQ